MARSGLAVDVVTLVAAMPSDSRLPRTTRPTGPPSPEHKDSAIINYLNLPLHIPEPLSMTRAAISSSSAMIAFDFIGGSGRVWISQLLRAK